jgi:hypothetical protein
VEELHVITRVSERSSVKIVRTGGAEEIRWHKKEKVEDSESIVIRFS